MNANLGDKQGAREAVVLFLGSGRLLCAAPGVLLWDDELQDEPGCPAGFLHGHRVAAVLQKIHFASRQRVCDDRGTGHVDHLSKRQAIIAWVWNVCFDRQGKGTRGNIGSSRVGCNYWACSQGMACVFMFCHTTWSCFPHITCTGAVIRCKCSCKAYLELSSKISINTAWQSGKRVSQVLCSVNVFFISLDLDTSSWTNLLGKMCCEAAARLRVPVESKQEEQMFKLWQREATANSSSNAAGRLSPMWTHSEIKSVFRFSSAVQTCWGILKRTWEQSLNMSSISSGVVGISGMFSV